MKRLTVFVLIMLLMSLTTPVVAGGKKPVPPRSHAFGKTLAKWQQLYWTWALGGNQAGQVGHVLFLPMPQGELRGGTGAPDDPFFFVGELDITLQPGTAFVTPVLVFIGESYVENVPDDTPLPEEIFTNAEVLVTLDGRPLINSSAEDISPYYFDAVFFDEPLFYDEPQPRGDPPGTINAQAALWVQGLGFAYPPLKVGQHTLTMFGDNRFGFSFFNTWRITVKPQSRKPGGDAN
jgi:hypothetical protein